MKDNVLPEEKLLRLIRGKNNKEIFPNKILQDTVTDLKPKIKPRILFSRYLSFLDVRNISILIFTVSLFYLIISFIYPWAGLKNLKIGESVPDKELEFIKDPSQGNIKPYEFYLEGIKNRAIFGSPTIEQTPKPVSGMTADLIKNINLIGIISGENPQAIIEDKNTQKTHYLSKGQFLGEFQLEDIREGKIILNFNGQLFELNL